MGLDEVLAPRGGERETVCGGDSDRRRAAYRERPDRLGDLRRGRAAEVDLSIGQAPLVEDDDGVVLEPDDRVRLQLAHVCVTLGASRSEAPDHQVPSSQLAR